MFKKNKVIKILTVPETGYMWRDGTYLQILGFLTFLYLAVQNVKKRFSLNVEQLRRSYEEDNVFHNDAVFFNYERKLKNEMDRI